MEYIIFYPLIVSVFLSVFFHRQLKVYGFSHSLTADNWSRFLCLVWPKYLRKKREVSELQAYKTSLLGRALYGLLIFRGNTDDLQFAYKRNVGEINKGLKAFEVKFFVFSIIVLQLLVFVSFLVLFWKLAAGSLFDLGYFSSSMNFINIFPVFLMIASLSSLVFFFYQVSRYYAVRRFFERAEELLKEPLADLLKEIKRP